MSIGAQIVLLDKDPDTGSMRRILIVGPSAAGKTTLASLLATRLGIPHLELDSLYHQAEWTPLPTPEFRALVAVVVSGDDWVIDGNYSRVQDLIVAGADTVVWLRMRRSLVMCQVLIRTARRMLSRQPLWNGNRESLHNVLSVDPERSIVAWAWLRHGKYDATYMAMQATAEPGQRWVVLRSRTHLRRWLRDNA